MIPTDKIKLEVVNVYDTWLISYLNGDIKTYDKYLDDEYHFVGSTNNEEFLNRRDTTQFFRETADQFAGKTDLRNNIKTIEQFGKLVFITHLFDAWFRNGKEWTFYSRFRFTSALRKNKEGWRFIYQHFSIPDSKTDEGETIGFDKVNEENKALREAIKRRTFELEKKNRTLEIEGALERIRAQAVAMKEPAELLDVVVTLRTEFINLGHEAHYFWHMMWLPDKYEKAMTSGDGTRIGMVMELPRDFHNQYAGMSEWENSDQAVMVLPLEIKDAVSYIQKMITLGDFQQVDPNAPTLDDIRHIGGITFIMARTSHGEIGYSLPGVVRNPPTEDLEILERFAGAFDLAHRRFLDLQKSEAQAREVQVELALEKVRSRTMAMQKSSELAETSLELFQQIKNLGFDTWSCGFCIWKEDDLVEAWMGADSDGLLPPMMLPYKEEKTHRKIYESFQNGESSHEKVWEGKELIAHYEFMQTFPSIKAAFDVIKESGLQLPTYQCYYVGFFKHGYLLLIAKELDPELKDLSIRFAKVFEQTYTRFLDLQKAEAQARKNQIELALERVRSKTMSIRHPDELSDVITLLADQLIHLGIELDSANFSNGLSEKDMDIWIYNKHFKPDMRTSRVHYPWFDHAMFHEIKKFIDDFKEGIDLNVSVFSKSELRTFIDYVFSETVYRDAEDKESIKNTFYEVPGYTWSVICLEDTWVSMNKFNITPFTDDENAIFRRFVNAFGQAYTRFLDLQKAEGQAREAKIEAALEKVRSRTMAMHKSDELPEAANVLFLEIQRLGIPAWSAGYNILSEDKKSSTCIMSSEGEIQAPFTLPLTKHKSLLPWHEAIIKGKDFFVYEQGGKDLIKHYEYMATLPELQVVFKQFEDAGISLPTHQINHLVKFTNGFLLFITYEQVPNAHDIFKRFGKVFEQTYTRFLDLQKAEAQTREAQINLAVERVRAKALAMYTSEGILEVVFKLKEEIMSLNIPNVAAATIHLPGKNGLHRVWDLSSITTTGGKINISMDVSYKLEDTDPDFFMRRIWSNREPYFLVTQDQEDLKRTIQWCRDHDLKEQADETEAFIKETQLKTLYHPTTQLANGRMSIDLLDPPTSEIETILKKMGGAFDLAYKRFEDLKNSEAQLRESQVEAALERVRSQSMGMQDSEDLSKVTTAMFDQLRLLGGDLYATGIVLCDKQKDHVEQWHSVPEAGMLTPFIVPINLDRIHKYRYDQWLKGKELFSIEINEDFISEHFETLFSLPSVQKVLKDFEERNISLPPTPSWEMDYGASFKYGYLLVSAVKPFEEANILPRFAKVFEQTYTRFLDLKNAENLAHKAKIEVALERVRARALAMQEPEELKEVAKVLRTEMGLLGIEELETCSIYINDMVVGKTECWYAMHELRVKKRKLINDHFEMDFNDTWVGQEMLKFYQSNADKTSIVMTGDHRVEWIRFCEKQSPLFQGYYGEVIPDRTYHLYKFSHGGIGVATPSAISEENWALLKRAASAFSLAYSRFRDLTQSRLDLHQLKEEKKRAEEALDELQATQKQLIQSEKMASLGELTSGIAHEIQNPLNFVNNFSELSSELIDEMNEEIEKGDLTEAKFIASDIKQNLEKINHHGNRADAIVKGMLQHSRKSTANKEPTDINNLADEYLRLAYHGLRAKDNTFNATLITDFDESIGLISLMPQDMGRVILNLITNAFYAVNEKKKEPLAGERGTENYIPTVTVSTKLIPLTSDASNEENLDKKIKPQEVIISVQDNGNGIPHQILDKIFQPFFTTKPTGQGTGLGLSMSYDIVKTHGGEVKVETIENEGTTFTIILYNKD